MGAIAALSPRQRGLELGGSVAPGQVGRGELLAGWILSPGAQQVVGLDGEGQPAQAFGTARAHSPACASSGAAAATRSRPAAASSTWTPTDARRSDWSSGDWERTRSRAISAAAIAGPTDCSHSTTRPWRRLRARSTATRTTANTTTAARMIQPQGVELEVCAGGLVVVVVLVGCEVVVDRARVVVVVGAVVVVVGAVVVVAGALVVVTGLVVVVAGLVVVVS